MKVPLLDLKPQYRALKSELDAALTKIGDLETELVNSGVVQVVSRERQAEMASEAAVQQNRSVYDPNFADQTIKAYPDDSHEMARRLAQEEGLFVGYSAGAAAWAAIELAKTLDEGVVVTIFPDSGEKYLSINR